MKTRKHIYSKDIARTIRGNFRRFLAIAVITILGVAMFSGLEAACEDLRRSADRFFDSQELFDLQILSTLGLTQDDVDALKKADGVEDAAGIWQETAEVRVGDSTVPVILRELCDSFNRPYLLSGRMPEKQDEALVTQKFLDDNGASVGDVFSVREAETEDKETGSNEESDGEEADGEEDDGLTLDFEEDSQTLLCTEFRIVGAVTDALEVNNTASGTVSFRSASTTRDAVYVLPEAFDTELYAAVCLRVAGAMDAQCYGGDYTARVAAVRRYIEDEIMEDREAARTLEIREDALEQIAEAESDAQAELDDARQELEEGEQTLKEELKKADTELEDGEKQLEEGRQQLEEGEAELDRREQDAEYQLAAAWQQLADKRQQLEAADAELKGKEQEAAAQLPDAEEKIAAGRRELDEQEQALQETIAAGREEIAAGLSQLEAGRSEIEAGLQQIRDGRAEAEAGAAQLAAALEQAQIVLEELRRAAEETPDPQTEAAIAAAEQQVAELQAQYDAAAQQIQQLAGQEAALMAQLEELAAKQTELEGKAAELDVQEQAAQEQFAAARAEISTQEQQLNEQKAALQAARQQIDDGFSQLEAGEAAYWQQAASGRQQIAAARAELEENKKKLEESEADLKEGRAEYEEEKRKGEAELEEGWEEYREGEAEAAEKIAGARKKVEEIDMADWYVQDRTSLGGYANIGSDADSIEAIATVFPIVFFIVAILISLTTIARMVEEDRGLIGTYKALGFTDREIRQKYLVYTGTAAGAGCAAGSLAAFFLLPWFICSIFSTMYLLPEYRYYFVPGYGIAGIALFAGGVLLAAWLACRKELQNMPAALMRPRAPKPGMRVFLEKMPSVWIRLSFLNKITARNLFRYKGRMLMTIAGIGGCTALLLFGFAIRDSVHDLMPRQYDQTVHYDLMAVAEQDKQETLKQDLESPEIASHTEARISSVVLKNADGKEMDAQLIVVPDGEALEPYITIETAEGKVCTPEDGDIFVTQNAGTVLDIGTGDQFRVQLPDLQRADLNVTALVKNYLGNYVYMTAGTYEEWFGEYEPNAALALFVEGFSEQKAFCDRLAGKEEILICVSRQELLDNFDTSFSLINMVVYVVIIMSAALAFVVLFTLAATNISERERELATIKVLGFYDREVHMYINKETVILTVIGILLGIPVGYAFAQTLTSILNLPSIYLAVSLHLASYGISVALALGFSLVVNLITDRTLDRIDPVEALKSVE